MKADFSLLFEKPDKDAEAILEIEPLAPLSIVSDLPGSYYKSIDKPTKNNLCGIMENILGWHLSVKDRQKLLKDLAKHYEKVYKLDEIAELKPNVPYKNYSYHPIIAHLFEVVLEINPVVKLRYDDIWKQQLFRDGYSHPKGTPNISYELIPKKINSDKKIEDFFKEHKGGFPMYYTSPGKREYIVLGGSYRYRVKINQILLNVLKERTNEYNIGYLGTNEGWVNLKIQNL